MTRQTRDVIAWAIPLTLAAVTLAVAIWVPGLLWLPAVLIVLWLAWATLAVWRGGRPD